MIFFVCLCESSQCCRKHLGPVWQIRWIQQQLRLTGEEKVEALISAAEDGRISKWFLSKNGIDCAGNVSAAGDSLSVNSAC